MKLTQLKSDVSKANIVSIKNELVRILRLLPY
jgi:hypothetical protein